VGWTSRDMGSGVPVLIVARPSPSGALVSVKTAADGAFGWGGTPVKLQHWCPEVGLSVTRNHAQEEKAKSPIDDEILGENPTRESEAYRSFANLAIGFQIARIQR
jgi:hypothetical protein